MIQEKICKTFQYALKQQNFDILDEVVKEANFIFNKCNELQEKHMKNYCLGVVTSPKPFSYEEMTSYVNCSEGKGFTKGGSKYFKYLSQTEIHAIVKQYFTSLKNSNEKATKMFFSKKKGKIIKNKNCIIVYKKNKKININVFLRKLQYRSNKNLEGSFILETNHCKLEQFQDEKTKKYFTSFIVTINKKQYKFIAFKDRKLEGNPVKFYFKRNSFGKWIVNVVCNISNNLNINTKNNNNVGVDRGINKIVYCSNGFQENPIDIRILERKMKTLQKKLGRQTEMCKKIHNLNKSIKGKESKRLLNTREKIKKLHNKIKQIRQDHTHKVTSKITNDVGVGYVFIEGLNIQNLTKSAKGTVDNPGKNVKAKAKLNKGFLNAAPGMIATQLEYKINYKGGKLIKVNQRNTSQQCSRCGSLPKKNELSYRNGTKFHCRNCGYDTHADYNASLNILARGEKNLDTNIEK